MSELTGYLAPEGFLTELTQELGSAVVETHGRLVLAHAPPTPVAWVANVWRDPVQIPIASIGDGAKKLRDIQRNWALYSSGHHRRAALIVDKLPKVSAKPLTFGTPAPVAPLGSWTLIAPDMMLAAASCSSPFPNGEVAFVEDRTAPSRAYLKLWDVLTLLGERPKPPELCIDLGSSPGGWTWVLQRLGARVISVDKAPLDPSVAMLPGVEYRGESAFGLDPRAIGPVDWLFSDVVCYPKRLLTLVQRWLAADAARRFVCTVKFQGATDFEAMQAFAAIPGSRLLHLHHNKHELTWIKLDDKA
ncbi:SAM-dependent methyltransferase [Rhodoplanes sp. Z2-YC6860]|uniref:SAM-dependent methyltransferase n=1 Tax=Rhodoplanes sp. Z2-YC6860 TaxID=674703 RepID=UPI00078B33D4|nr:SAM-dependent methyltransferase [Rhodoplanes sp. Z2-YC6860]AMN42716.1 LSU rRNA 2'-O-methyl-C2498 methyltransferase RlmM [Rhodoplanes sp. Z2-YC6860]